MKSSTPLSLAEADTVLAEAARKVSETDLSEALSLYIKAAQAYLHLSRTLTAGSGQAETEIAGLKARCRERASQALQRAEQIKAAKGLVGTSSIMPVRRNRFSTEEQYAIVDQSSRINKLKVTPWMLPPTDSEFATPDPFFDSDGLLPLSVAQTSRLSSWVRPSSADGGEHFVMWAAEMSPEVIVQEAITNCSVIAALAVCWQHHQRFNSKLGASSIYPQDENGMPRLSQNGKYVIKLFMNGTSRQIVIDDRLPKGKDGRMLCASTLNTNSLWPALMEKAYLKLLGGYDFPGSNSAFDIHAFTGWIPDQIDFRSSSFQREQTWRRLTAGFDAGHCVFTLGTGEEIRSQPRATRLIPRHNYAVLALRESAKSRGVRILDSWRSPTTQDSSALTGATTPDKGLRTSCHWIDWDEACQTFDMGFLNWDPGRLFAFTRSFHGIWKSDDSTSTRFKDQLRVTPLWPSKPTLLAAPSELWILLTQHVTTSEIRLPFTALNVVRSIGDGSLTRQDMLGLQAAYTDGMHTLCRVPLHRQDTHLSLILSRDVHSDQSASSTSSSAYTVSLCSNIDFYLTDPSSKVTYSKKINGSFTSTTCGGHSQHRTFMRNPQYSLSIQIPPLMVGATSASKTVAIRVTMEASRDLPLNLSVVWGNGRRITELNQGDIQLSTGPYSYGIATSEGSLKPGIYTLVASAFEPGRKGPFYISIEGETPILLEPIAQEGAGMYFKLVKGCWRSAYTASSPSPGRDQAYVKYSLQVERTTTILCRLQSVATQQRIAVSFSVFSSGVTLGNLGPQLITGDPYSDRVSGVASEPTLLTGPATYVAVVSTMDVGVEGEFEFTTYSSACPVTVQAIDG